MTTVVAGAERTAGTLAGGAPARRRSPTLAGSWALVRFMLRLDRLRLPVWIAGIALTVLSSASSVKALYPTQADLEAAEAKELGVELRYPSLEQGIAASLGETD